MLIVRDPGEMRHLSSKFGSVVLVPTMGALHLGHASLIERAREIADHGTSRVVVSIFVNPLQFGDPADFANYPSTFDDDLAMCERLGVSAVYAPGASDVYPEGYATTVSVSGVSARWEGASRSGHFDGVATVVTKLFAACRPKVAVFGRKDLQQVAVVRRLTRDLDLGVDIVAAPTVRDHDGLALSSRNVRLGPDARRRALVLPAALRLGVEVALGEGVPAARRAMLASVEELPEIEVDYLDFVDDATMEPVDRVAPGTSAIGAIVVSGVRLIDNLELSASA